MNGGAMKRRTRSQRRGAAGHSRMARHMPAAAVLSTTELRRLVAAMVD